MSKESMYRELNLEEGASLKEIKAAYRKMAKIFHPDSDHAGPGDPEKFRRAHMAYRGLLKDAPGDRDLEKKGPAAGGHGAKKVPYVFNGVTKVGLDVYYDILMVKPQGSGKVALNLPWTRTETCPRCLGEGVLLKRCGNGYVYKPHRCEKCEGRGVVREETRIEVALSSAALETGRLRLRNAGDFSPKDSKRGDLIIRIGYAERLPREN